MSELGLFSRHPNFLPSRRPWSVAGSVQEHKDPPPPLAKDGTFGICRLDADYFRQEASRSIPSLTGTRSGEGEGEGEGGFSIVNFYHLTDIRDPHAWLAQHR